MARINIEDLPKDIEISREEMRKVLGGMLRQGASTELASGLSGTGLAPASLTLSPGHGYTVLGTFADSAGNQSVSLRNQWGTAEGGSTENSTQMQKVPLKSKLAV